MPVNEKCDKVHWQNKHRKVTVMGNIIVYNTTRKRVYYQGGEYMCTILRKIRNKTPYDLLAEYDVSQKPPVDISKLLENIGISTIAKDFSEIEHLMEADAGSILGAAFSNGNNLAIFYKKNESLHRKKFTIAHELAHCCLDCPNDESSHIEFRLGPCMNLSDEDIKKEERANVFAGQLLIPSAPLITYYDKMIVPSLTELAKIFDVSSSVMSARLDFLKLPYFKDDLSE